MGVENGAIILYYAEIHTHKSEGERERGRGEWKKSSYQRNHYTRDTHKDMIYVMVERADQGKERDGRGEEILHYEDNNISWVYSTTY